MREAGTRGEDERGERRSGPGSSGSPVPVLVLVIEVFLLLVLLLPAGRLAAQEPGRAQAAPETTGHLVGSLRDATTGEPIRLAVVTLPDLDREAVSDSAGRFDLAFVPAGVHRIVVRHIRYGVRTARVEIQAGRAVGTEIRLDPEAIQLEPLEVTVRRLNPDLLGTGYYRRQMGGATGFFADEEYLTQPVRKSLPLGAALETMREVVMRLGLRSSGGCRVTMIDGRLYRGYEPLYATDLAGIEVYRRHEVPLEVQVSLPPDRLPSECDLVLLWTDRDGQVPGEDSLRALGGG